MKCLTSQIGAFLTAIILMSVAFNFHVEPAKADAGVGAGAVSSQGGPDGINTSIEAGGGAKLEPGAAAQGSNIGIGAPTPPQKAIKENVPVKGNAKSFRKGSNSATPSP